MSTSTHIRNAMAALGGNVLLGVLLVVLLPVVWVENVIFTEPSDEETESGAFSDDPAR